MKVRLKSKTTTQNTPRVVVTTTTTLERTGMAATPSWDANQCLNVIEVHTTLDGELYLPPP